MMLFLNYAKYYKRKNWAWTLDDVTGVLPIAVGKATRVIEYMTEAGKVYEGEITIGFSYRLLVEGSKLRRSIWQYHFGNHTNSSYVFSG